MLIVQYETANTAIMRETLERETFCACACACAWCKEAYMVFTEQKCQLRV